jgi:hypothetical protein
MVRQGKPIQFRVYFATRQGYVKVFIWKNHGDMLAGAGILNHPDYDACYIQFEAPVVHKDGGVMQFGELHFCHDSVKPHIVAHELTHVLFDLIYKIGIKVTVPHPSERPSSRHNKKCEYLCHEMEYLTKGFWNAYNKRTPPW